MSSAIPTVQSERTLTGVELVPMVLPNGETWIIESFLLAKVLEFLGGDSGELGIEVGSIIEAFSHDEDRYILRQFTGAYSFNFIWIDKPLEVGDKVLIRGRNDDADGTVRLRAGRDPDGDWLTASGAFVDEFTVLDVTAAVSAQTGFSVWIEGDEAGSVRYDITHVFITRGTNDLGIGAVKIMILTAPDLENFPPAFNAERVYSVGNKFHYENDVYEVIVPIVGVTPPDARYYRILQDVPRVARWSLFGNTEPIPMGKLPDIGTDGIPANMVENFSKTNFPDTKVPHQKLPDIEIRRSADGLLIYYEGELVTGRNVYPANSESAGVMIPEQFIKLRELHAWAHLDERLPKDALPTDVVYGVPTRAGEWTDSKAYRDGQIIRATETGGNRRYFLALRDNSNINPLRANSSWIELGLQPSNYRIRGRGQWNAGTAYEPGDMVTTVECLFICTSAITSATNPKNDSQHWDLLFYLTVDSSAIGEVFIALDDGANDGVEVSPGWMFWRGPWGSGNYYSPQNVVSYQNQKYICLSYHQANNTNRPMGGAHSATYWEVW